jgi:hypothetical protein
MKLENQDLIDQLETEKMMLLNIVRCMTADMEAIVACGRLDTPMLRKVTPNLYAAWDAVAWITAWDSEQAA